MSYIGYQILSHIIVEQNFEEKNIELKSNSVPAEKFLNNQYN